MVNDPAPPSSEAEWKRAWKMRLSEMHALEARAEAAERERDAAEMRRGHASDAMRLYRDRTEAAEQALAVETGSREGITARCNELESQLASLSDEGAIERGARALIAEVGGEDAKVEPPCALCGTTLELDSGDCAICAARAVRDAMLRESDG